jgi:hypothetical protein
MIVAAIFPVYSQLVIALAKPGKTATQTTNPKAARPRVKRLFFIFITFMLHPQNKQA